MDDTNFVGIVRAIIVLVAGLIGAFTGIGIISMMIGQLYLWDLDGFLSVLVIEASCVGALLLACGLPALIERLPRATKVERRNGFMPSGCHKRGKQVRLDQAAADRLRDNTYG